MLDNRISDAINNLTIEEKYNLLKNLEVKHLGDNEKYDEKFFNSIVNILLNGTTLIEKIFHII